MSDVVQRAKTMISTIALAQVYSLGQAYPDQIVAKMLGDMLAEVERLTPRRIETEAEMNALPIKSVVITPGGNPLVHGHARGNWAGTHDYPLLPVTLIYTPDAAS